MSIREIGVRAAVCPATWGIAQLGTGTLSDKLGRERFIVGGMWVQASEIALVTFKHRDMSRHYMAGAIIGKRSTPGAAGDA